MDFSSAKLLYLADKKAHRNLDITAAQFRTTSYTSNTCLPDFFMDADRIVKMLREEGKIVIDVDHYNSLAEEGAAVPSLSQNTH